MSKVEEILIECERCNGDGYIDDEYNPNESVDCPACDGVACWIVTKEKK